MLVFHAEHYVGRNKKDFCFGTSAGSCVGDFLKKVKLKFLVAGRTRNLSDGAFRHVKRIYNCSP